MLPASDDFAHIPQDPKNPLTTSKVQLGQLLFHETRLGGNPKKITGIYTYSCATCHHAEAGFQSGLAQSLGEGGAGFGTEKEKRAEDPAEQKTVTRRRLFPFHRPQQRHQREPCKIPVLKIGKRENQQHRRHDSKQSVFPGRQDSSKWRNFHVG